MNAVPEDHKNFLADMVWVHEEDDVCIETQEGVKHCKLIAVHAGLERGKNFREQLEFLKARDARVSKVTNLSGTKDVWDMPKELTKTIVVSGHHGKLHIDVLRLIIDEGGGMEGNPVAAIVLPSMKISVTLIVLFSSMFVINSFCIVDELARRGSSNFVADINIVDLIIEQNNYVLYKSVPNFMANLVANDIAGKL